VTDQRNDVPTRDEMRELISDYQIDRASLRSVDAALEALYRALSKAERDTKRLDWLEAEARHGPGHYLSWCARQKSGVEESIQYDIPAGFYADDFCEPQPNLRTAIDVCVGRVALSGRGRGGEVMKCPVCIETGERSTVHTNGYGLRTLMGFSPGYYDEDGQWVRNRDPNTTTQDYACSRGHTFSIAMREDEEDVITVHRRDDMTKPTDRPAEAALNLISQDGGATQEGR
jgi:hypothetical protein